MINSLKNIKFFFCFLAMSMVFVFSCKNEKQNVQKTVGEEEIYRSEKQVDKPLIYAGGWQKPGAEYQWAPVWQSDSHLTIPRGSAAAVAHKGYIYIMGGGNIAGDTNIIHSTVEFARINPDGSLGKWKITSPMNTKRIFASTVAVGDFIYITGGEKGYTHEDLLNTTEKAKIQPDGSLGPWEFEKSELNTPRRAPVASYFNDSIYVFGGFNGNFLSDVERAKVNPDGSLQKWIYEAEQASGERYIHSGLIHKNYVYLFGGHVRSTIIATDTAEWSTIKADGVLAAWKPLSPMPTNRIGGGAVVVSDQVYVIGGQNTIQLSAVDRAEIKADGSLGDWSEETALKDSRVGVALATENEVIYAIGGFKDNKYLTEVLRTYHVKNSPLGMWTNDAKIIKESQDPNRIPLDAINHFKLAWTYIVDKKYEASITELNLGIKIKKELSDPYNLLGAAYHELKKFDDAVKSYKEAIRLSPQTGPIYQNLGNTYLAMGNVKNAEDMYKEASRINPEEIEPKLRLLNLLAEADRCNEARELMKTMPAAEPNNPQIQKIEMRCKENVRLL